MLTGKTALVTGSTSGIGLGIAQALPPKVPTSSSMALVRLKAPSRPYAKRPASVPSKSNTTVPT